MSIFAEPQFVFPYAYKFPGQASDERILFVTRENQVMLWVRRLGIMVAALVMGIAGGALGEFLTSMLGPQVGDPVVLVSILLAVAFGSLGWWWTTTLWQKSLMLVTTHRLTKFIYTTPFNRHNL